MSQTLLPTPAIERRIRWSHRDIPLAHTHHVCGRVAFTPPALSIAVESDLESQIVHWLINQPGLLALHSQPFTLSYSDGRRRYRYTPDLLSVFSHLPRALVRRHFGLWTVIEVKSVAAYATEHAAIARRLVAVRDALGLEAVCLTEVDLTTRRH